MYPFCADGSSAGDSDIDQCLDGGDDGQSACSTGNGANNCGTGNAAAAGGCMGTGMSVGVLNACEAGGNTS